MMKDILLVSLIMAFTTKSLAFPHRPQTRFVKRDQGINAKGDKICQKGFYKFQENCFRCEKGCFSDDYCGADGCQRCLRGYSREASLYKNGIFACNKVGFKFDKLTMIIISFLAVLILASISVMLVFVIRRGKGGKDGEKEPEENYRFPPLDSPKQSEDCYEKVEDVV